MQKIRYPSLAQAIGAFVAGEFEACQCEPARLMPPLGEEGDPRTRPVETTFDMVKFEGHLDGLLSDLVDLCMVPPKGVSQCGFDPYKHKGAVVLCYAMADEVLAGEPKEWQICAQGYACIEAE